MQLPFIDKGIPELTIDDSKEAVCGEQEFIEDIGTHAIRFTEYVEVIGDIAFADVAMADASAYNFCDSILFFRRARFN